jgi:hypothetical protein
MALLPLALTECGGSGGPSLFLPPPCPCAWGVAGWGLNEQVRHKNARPGHLSEALRNALGMPDDKAPPPWLRMMQRYGPPPSYPYLKVPGVNCPIPPGARWGHNDGEWGQPPVDAYSRPLFGDVFGQARGEEAGEKADRTPWGAMMVDEDEPDSDEGPPRSPLLHAGRRRAPAALCTDPVDPSHMCRCSVQIRAETMRMRR